MLNQYVKDICKIGQGRECCRYLTIAESGFNCEKLSSLKPLLDLATRMTARGDNCDGLVEVEYRLKLNAQRASVMADDKFTCAKCGGTFDKEWSDEDAMREANDNGFLDKPEPLVLVCDDCYNEAMALYG